MANQTSFKAGQSGNPGGRKHDKALTALAREFTEEALKTLGEIMRDVAQRGADRVKAAEVLLDRGWGKPREAVELSGPDGGPVQVVDYSALSEDEILTALMLQRKAVATDAAKEAVH